MNELSRTTVIALGAAPARHGARVAPAATAPAVIVRKSRRVFMASSGVTVYGESSLPDSRRAERDLSRPRGPARSAARCGRSALTASSWHRTGPFEGRSAGGGPSDAERESPRRSAHAL